MNYSVLQSAINQVKMPSNIIVYGSAILTIFVLALLRKILAFVSKIRLHKEALKDVNSGPVHWLYGNVEKASGFDSNVLKSRIKSLEEYPKVTKRWIGFMFGTLILYFPSIIQEIITTDEPKDEFVYGTIKRWIGDGLLISKGSKWKRNRRLLTGAFHFAMLKRYLNVFNTTTHTMLRKWKSEKNVCAFESVSLMTLDSMLQCTMSSKTNCQSTGKNHPYISAVYDMTTIAGKRFFNPLYISDFIFYNFSSLGRAFKKACDIAHVYSQNEIDKRKEFYKVHGKPDVRASESEYSETKLDFLDILLLARDENGKGLSDLEVRDEVDTFLFEGHDTTASAISWALYNFAVYPHYQEKCRQEIQSILGAREYVENADLAKMTYLTIFIKESMRLYPPVFSITRSLSKPFRFTRGFGSDQTVIDESTPPAADASKTFPPSLPVTIRINMLHRNPHVWKNPDNFDPDRFLPENVSKRSAYAYIPFSAGPRNCIGQNFAMMEVKVALALCLKMFRLTIDTDKPKTEILMSVTTKTKNDIYLKIENLCN